MLRRTTRSAGPLILTVLALASTALASPSSSQEARSPEEEPAGVLDGLTADERSDIVDVYGVSAEELLEMPGDEAIDVLLDGRLATPLAALEQMSKEDFADVVNSQVTLRVFYGLDGDRRAVGDLLLTEQGAESLQQDPFTMTKSEQDSVLPRLAAMNERMTALDSIRMLGGFGESFANNTEGTYVVVAVPGSEASAAVGRLGDDGIEIVATAVGRSDLEAVWPDIADQFAYQSDGSLTYDSSRGGPSLTEMQDLLSAQGIEATVGEADTPVTFRDGFDDAYCRGRSPNECGQNRGGVGYDARFPNGTGEVCSTGMAVEHNNGGLGYITARHCFYSDIGQFISWGRVYQRAHNSNGYAGAVLPASSPDAAILWMPASSTTIAPVTSSYLRIPGVINAESFDQAGTPGMNDVICGVGRNAAAPRCGFVYQTSPIVAASIPGSGGIISGGDSGGLAFAGSNPTRGVGIIQGENSGGTNFSIETPTSMAGLLGSNWNYYFGADEGASNLGRRHHLFSLYDVSYLRSPDPGGWSYYLSRWNTSCTTRLRSDTRQIIGYSPEIVALWPLTSISNSESRVRIAYEAALGREPDAGGLAFWTNYVWINSSSSVASREARWHGFLDFTVTNSNEFAGRIATGSVGDRALCS